VQYTLEEQIAAVVQEIPLSKMYYGEHSNRHGVLAAILQTLEEMQRLRAADSVDSENLSRRLVWFVENEGWLVL
jgi:hypothetical protein